MRCALGAALLLLLPCGVQARSQFLFGHVPAAATHLQPIGDLEKTRRLEVLIGLPLRNRSALTNLLNDLYNPANPSYHQYLTAAQFAEQFGPTTDDYQAVTDFARSNGLTVLETYANRTLLRISGSVADLEKAFHVRLRHYQHPKEARIFYAPDAEPSVDLPTPLLGITGLDDYTLPHPLLARKPRRHLESPLSGSGPEGSFDGSDFRSAYVPGSVLTGAGQQVGLFELDTYYPSDISAYESNAGLPGVPLKNVTLPGASTSPGDDNIEVTLDIDMAISMAPGLTGVIVYQGPESSTGPNSVLNCMATNNTARQLSCSWAFAVNSQTAQIFQEFAAQGQSFFLSSGDSGAFAGAAQPPSDNPYVTVVGGTTLTTSGPSGAWVSEKVWNWNSDGTGTNGSTGGISTTYSIPRWQAPVSMAANQGSTNMRNLPDVALTADNIYVIADNGQDYSVGGTSCAAPLWAGFTALVNQQGAANQCAPVGFLNPALYALGLGSNYGATFHDITVGNNTNAAVATKYFAQPGYDLCTGWGTPAGTNMINALAPLATAPDISWTVTLASESCLPTNGVIDPGETATLNLTLTNASPIATSQLMVNLRPGSALLAPSGQQCYGALRSGGIAVTLPFTFTAAGSCGDTIYVVWQLQDGTSDLGSLSVNYTLGALIPSTTLAQNFDAATAPYLPFGWTTSAIASQAWIATNGVYDSLPNSAFAADVTDAGVAYLYSPVIPILSARPRLTFRQNYNLEASPNGRHSRYYDGGVLEIAVNAGKFTDITWGGGNFVTGGYNCTLYNYSDNPLRNRDAWGGDSGGWITTAVNLPPDATGQMVQLRWGCATDTGNLTPGVGWYIDSISLKDAVYSCCGDSAALSVSQTVAPADLVVGQEATYTIVVTNAGPDLAEDVVVTDTLPADVLFIDAWPEGLSTNEMITWQAGAIASGGSASMTVTVLPMESGAITNTVIAASVTPISNPGSNVAVAIITVCDSPPLIARCISLSPGGVLSVSVDSILGLQYSLACKNCLSDPAWTILSASTVAGTGGVIQLSDRSPAQAQRFYVVIAN